MGFKVALPCADCWLPKLAISAKVLLFLLMVAISEGTPVIRQVRLLSEGSSSWVNINERDVRLTVQQDGYEELRFVSAEGVGKVKIYGVKSQRWLCYNKNWKLVGKRNGTEGRLGDRCVFSEELYENYYYIYRPMADTKRLLGFRKTGFPTKGVVKPNQPTEDYFFSKIDEKFNHELSFHNEIKSGPNEIKSGPRESRPYTPLSPPLVRDPPPTGRRKRPNKSQRPKNRRRHHHGRRKPKDNNTAVVHHTK